jgi:hypothetical protein
MTSSKTLIMSSKPCPLCGGPLHYVDTRFYFLRHLKKRMCLNPDCQYVDPRRYKMHNHDKPFVSPHHQDRAT